jgi:hypothetical protein
MVDDNSRAEARAHRVHDIRACYFHGVSRVLFGVSLLCRKCAIHGAGMAPMGLFPHSDFPRHPCYGDSSDGRTHGDPRAARTF